MAPKESGLEGLDPGLKWALLVFLGVLPALFTAGTATVAFERAQTLDFCSSCHVMHGHVNDLKDPDSESLAAKHHQYRWINQNACYTCHTDYDFLGPVHAKLNGLKHVAVYYSGLKRPLELYKPFPNKNCLQCHSSSPSFERNPVHEPMLEELRSGAMSCLDCHRPIHQPGGAP